MVSDQDNNFYLIRVSILVTCSVDNVRYFRERLHVYYVYELKGETTKKKNPKTEGYTPHKHRMKKWLFTLLWINLIGQNGP